MAVSRALSYLGLFLTTSFLIERFGVEPSEMEQSLDALAYLILHIAKVKAGEAELEIIYEQSGLNP